MEFLKKLNGPDLVVNFQKCFGVLPRDGFVKQTGNDTHENTNGHVNGISVTDKEISHGHTDKNTKMVFKNGIVIPNGKPISNGNIPAYKWCPLKKCNQRLKQWKSFHYRKTGLTILWKLKR